MRMSGTIIDTSLLDGFEGAEVISNYAKKFRRDDFPSLDVANPLDLFPNQPKSFDSSVIENWDGSKPWIHANRAGVYLAYTEDKRLIYIGTSQLLSKRLYKYFGGGETCVLKQTTWPLPPRFIVTIAVPDFFKPEAFALEAYLINELNPPWNVMLRSEKDRLQT